MSNYSPAYTISQITRDEYKAMSKDPIYKAALDVLLSKKEITFSDTATEVRA